MSALSAHDVNQWLDAYKKAWETQDSDLIADIFSHDAIYRVDPFHETHTGQDAIRQYWDNNPKTQSNIHFSYRLLAVHDDYGIAHWQARFDKNGNQSHLDGIFKLHFNNNKKCTALYEWWHKTKTPFEKGL